MSVDNRALSLQQSRYLRAHAATAVQWHLWEEATFHLAQRQQRPLLLLIGHTAAPLCQRLRQTTFVDNATTELMNRHFINVLVDGDERPDLYQIYQTCQQLLNGYSGSWPITAFINSLSLLPFVMAEVTCFDPNATPINFKTLLQQVAHDYHHEYAAIQHQNSQLHLYLDALQPATATHNILNSYPIDHAYHQLRGDFERSPATLSGPHTERLLRHWALTEPGGDSQSLTLSMALASLRRLTDAQESILTWPEQLYHLKLLATAAHLTPEPLFSERAHTLADYLHRNSQTSSGGFYDPNGRNSADERSFITAWNGLALGSFATAARYLRSREYGEIAVQCGRFIQTALFDTTLHHLCYSATTPTLPAFLDDYAYLLDGLLQLLQLRWSDNEAHFATLLAESMLTLFREERTGGFFYSSTTHERLFYRPTLFADGTVPAANAVAAGALLRLGHLLAKPHYIDAAKQVVLAVWEPLCNHPATYATLVTTLEELRYPPQTLFLRGSQPLSAVWQATCERDYAPRHTVITIAHGGNALPGAHHTTEEVIAYRCDAYACSAPLTSLAQLQQELQRFR